MDICTYYVWESEIIIIYPFEVSKTSKLRIALAKNNNNMAQ